MARNIAKVAIPLVAAPLVLVGALSSAPATAGDKEFGCTVQRNIEAQTVNHDPQYEGKLMEGGIGVRSAAAVNRYMTDKIRPLLSADLRSDVGQQGGAMKSGDPSQGTGK